MNLLNASQSTECGLVWKRYSKQMPLRDVAPALNGRASLAGARGHAERALQASWWQEHGAAHTEGLERSRRANWKHGYYSREAKAERSRVRAGILAVLG